jgi:hypothetical protein
MHAVVYKLIIAALAGCVALSPGDSLARDGAPSTGSPARAGVVPLEDMLRRMHDYLTTNDLKFETQFSTKDSVLQTSSGGRAEFTIRQPNLFRIKINAGNKSDLFVSDGQSIWVQRGSKFAQFMAKDTVLGTMYAAAGMMLMPSRILDAFWTVDYLEKVREDVRTSAIPDATIAGRLCRGIRVTRFEDEFDLWIDAAPPHRPCKLISQRSDGNSKAVSTHVFKWLDATGLAADAFRFSPPKGASRTDHFDPR